MFVCVKYFLSFFFFFLAVLSWYHQVRSVSLDKVCGVAVANLFFIFVEAKNKKNGCRKDGFINIFSE